MFLESNAGRKAARLLRALAVNKGDWLSTTSYVEQSNWIDKSEVKAAVAAMSLGTSSSIAGMPGEDFVAMVYPQTLVGRMTALRRIPLRTKTIVQQAGTRAFWVAEGANKPLSVAAFSAIAAMEPRKVTALAVITEELARMSEAEAIIKSDLGGAAVAALDLSFIDPGNAGVANEEPASVTNGGTAVPSSGSTPSAVRADFQALIDAFGGDLRTAVLTAHPRTALALSLMQSELGDVSLDIANGTGRLFGLPVLLSTSVPIDTSGSSIALIDANGIEFAGGDEAKFRTSTESAILMSDTPGTGASQLVSLWQTDSAALLGEIFVNWRTVREGSVAYLSGVNYGG